MVEIKTINFSVIEILPSLLNRTKTQTIRKAWEELKPHTFIPDTRELPHLDKNRIVDKPPRFKVGESVSLQWKQRSKYKWFCKFCGKDDKDGKGCKCIESLKVRFTPAFSKHLGNAIITEVFKIEIRKIFEGADTIENPIYHIFKIDKTPLGIEQKTKMDFIDLAKRDGFASANNMFKAIDKLYSLRESKEFWVYRFRWIK